MTCYVWVFEFTAWIWAKPFHLDSNIQFIDFESLFREETWVL